MKRLGTIGTYLLLALLCFTGNTYAQRSNPKPQVIAGPMLGYIEHREALVWIETQYAQNIRIEYYPEGRPSEARVTETSADNLNGYTISHFILADLDMNTRYRYRLWLDNTEKTFPYPLQFTTKNVWEYRTDPPAFSFLAGSCAYINDSLYDRPGAPYGKGTEIFRHMANTDAQLMLWLGDNTYLREADYTSTSGIYYRYRHTRSIPDLQQLLATKHNYATWDDHDYGPNDANRSYELKETTLQAFKDNWGNKSYGETDNPGVYGKFTYSDCDFFLLDDRYYRDASEAKDTLAPGRAQLGARQMLWLKNALAGSRATFKFIAMGGQFLNENCAYEAFIDYPREREELLNYIEQQRITGVIFLSGDRHHTEVIGKQLSTYKVYDITSSPLTSGAGNPQNGPEGTNPMRVPNTLVADQNYCQFFITGPRTNRLLTVKCFDKTNALRWEWSVKASDLK